MKTVKAFSPGGREPSRFKPISVEAASSLLAEREHKQQPIQCSYAFMDALDLKAPALVFTGQAETASVGIWELVMSGSGAFIAQDGVAHISEG